MDLHQYTAVFSQIPPYPYPPIPCPPTPTPNTPTLPSQCFQNPCSTITEPTLSGKSCVSPVTDLVREIPCKPSDGFAPVCNGLTDSSVPQALPPTPSSHPTPKTQLSSQCFQNPCRTTTELIKLSGKSRVSSEMDLHQYAAVFSDSSLPLPPPHPTPPQAHPLYPVNASKVPVLQ